MMLRSYRDSAENGATPEYEHDCTRCVFLGSNTYVDLEDPKEPTVITDIYAHFDRSLKSISILIRDSNEPSEYESMNTDAIGPVMNEDFVWGLQKAVKYMFTKEES
jgi:hypothetical protein